MARILTALSGGVDSSVAAALLLEQGHEVVGVFMRNGVSAEGAARSKSCCSASDARDAAGIADRLGVPFYSVDYAQEFAGIIDFFAAEYRRGRTPNPCVLCNQDLKFGHLFELAESFGAEAVATGHYAQAVDGGLYRAADRDKDQSYYLFGVDREALPRVHFPLGGMTKSEVRDLARERGLVTADKPESMEICFVTSGHYRDVVAAHGGAGQPGRFVDSAGRELGRHDGVDGFTVGQRRGLPALGVPHYVQSIDPADGTVVLCPRESLDQDRAAVAGLRWLVDPPRQPLELEVQIRARAEAVPARLEPLEGGRASLRFDRPQPAVTPGQAAVFYRGARVLGGGWLD